MLLYKSNHNCQPTADCNGFVNLGINAIKYLLPETNNLIKMKAGRQTDFSYVILINYQGVSQYVIYEFDSLFPSNEFPDYVYKPFGLPLEKRVAIFQKYYLNNDGKWEICELKRG